MRRRIGLNAGCVALAALFVGLLGALIYRDLGRAPTLPVWIHGGLGIAGAVSMGMLWAPVGIKRQFVLVMISGLATLYAFEGYLGITEIEDPIPRRAAAAQAAGVDYDMRTKFEVVRDLRAAGESAYPSFQPWYWIDNLWPHDLKPFGSVSRSTTVLCNETGAFSIYLSDRYGFNNDDRIYDKPVNVALIGDSFVHGACVPPGRDIAGQLRGLGLAAAGLGVHGTSTLSQLAVLREHARPLRPDWVVLVYFEGNDLADLHREAASPLLQSYLDPAFSQHLIDRQANVDALLARFFEQGIEVQRAALDQRRLQIRVARFVKLSLLRRRLNLTARPPPIDSLPLLRRLLTQIKQETEGWGGRLMLVYMPARARFAQGARLSPQLMHRAAVLSVFASLNVPIVDVAARFARDADPLARYVFRSAAHLTPEAYAAVAALIRDALMAPGISL